MKKEKIKIKIKQTVVLAVSGILTTIIGISMIIMYGMWYVGRDMPITSEIQDNYSVEKYDIKQTGPKYTLQDPEKEIEENITSVVTETTDTQKSNRLEDIMNVLSTEME